MKELIIGTGNAAEKKAIQSALTPLGITIKGTDDFGIVLEIEEDGTTAQENARKKSLLYCKSQH
jgi:inosine/xanthosine triphosphate pyrophosphatase family protein